MSLAGRSGLGYVLSVAAVAIVLCVLADVGVVPIAAVLLVGLPLGPIGLVLAIVLLAASSAITVAGDGSPGSLVAIDALVLVGVVGVAVANVAIVTRIRRRLEELPVPVAYRGRVPIVWDRILGVGAFVTAGGLFIAVCVLAGFLALVAGGIDTPAPAGQATAVRAICEVAWLAGTVAAIGGVVLWAVAARRGRAMLRWGAADLLVQAGAIGGLIASAAVGG